MWYIFQKLSCLIFTYYKIGLFLSPLMRSLETCPRNVQDNGAMKLSLDIIPDLFQMLHSKITLLFCFGTKIDWLLLSPEMIVLYNYLATIFEWYHLFVVSTAPPPTLVAGSMNKWSHTLQAVLHFLAVFWSPPAQNKKMKW